jgi:hypothetical protein
MNLEGRPIHVLEKRKIKGGEMYVVVLGADEPFDLQHPKIREYTDKIAKKAGYEIFLEQGDIMTPSQNLLVYRKFFYRKR